MENEKACSASQRSVNLRCYSVFDDTLSFHTRFAFRRRSVSVYMLHLTVKYDDPLLSGLVCHLLEELVIHVGVVYRQVP